MSVSLHPLEKVHKGADPLFVEEKKEEEDEEEQEEEQQEEQEEEATSGSPAKEQKFSELSAEVGVGEVLQSFTCSLQVGTGSLLADAVPQGVLYLTAEKLFYLSNRGLTVKERLKFCEGYGEVEFAKRKSRTIEVLLSLKKVQFSSFFSRDKAFETLSLLKKQGGNVDNDTVDALKYPKETKVLCELVPSMPQDEVVLQHYSCSLNDSMQGRLYITNYYVMYFHTKTRFTSEKKEVIPFAEIISLTQHGSTGVFVGNPGIEIVTKKNAMFVFRSFITFEKGYQFITALYKKFQDRPAVFKFPLYRIIQREARDIWIPQMVEQCVEYIKKHTLQLEGIFRISPSINLMRQIQRKIDAGRPTDFSQYHDPHLPSGILKLFFRELPDPLFSAEFYSCFLMLRHQKDLLTEEERRKKFINLFDLLPPVNKVVSKYLLAFLNDVSQYSEQNKMSLRNLGTVWGPLLLRAGEQEENPSDQMGDAIAIVELAESAMAYVKYLG